jgi:transposase
LHLNGIDNHAMPSTVITDELWRRLEPLLPVRQRRFRHPGRLRTPNRAALEGILFAARTGVSWNDLPNSLFGASGACLGPKLG